ATEKGQKLYDNWQGKLDQLKADSPKRAEAFENRLARKLPQNWDEILPHFEEASKGMATRAASGKVLNALAKHIPSLIGGSADLTGSNKTWLDEEGIFSPEDYSGKNIHFGVREHGMGAALNGMALHKGVIPYGGTFFVFSDYCRPAIRIAALSNIPSIFVFTHDSIGLGEDGPTHQPIEHLASVRAMPNTMVLRPADANETAWAWKAALEHTDGPTLLILTRQGLPVLEQDENAGAEQATKGAYIIADSSGDTPDLILIGTGSEVQLALKAQKQLREQSIDARVVSMPSWELFAQQDEAYQEKVLPASVTARISVEAAATFGWERWI